jgi:hypothetical protein
MGQLTARCSEAQTAQQAACLMAPQMSQRSAHLTAASTDEDHSTTEGVADGLSDGSCSETQTAQQPARWMVPQLDLRSARLTVASTAQAMAS